MFSAVSKVIHVVCTSVVTQQTGTASSIIPPVYITQSMMGTLVGKSQNIFIP